MDITIENLTKNYANQKAVNDISFKVKTGEVLGFLGPNGAGKSTTMKMITGYIGFREGNIFIGNKNVKEETDATKRHIGYLPENNPLYLDMAVTDYLKFCGELQGLSSKKVGSRVRDMIAVCGLNVEKHKKISELSKGYRQRVGLAQAMIHDPEILILDEPTTGLDPNQIIEIRKLIRDLGKEKTVVLSTHILPEVEATCDRILIINKGVIVADGTAETLRRKSKGQEVLRLKIEGSEDYETVLKTIKSIKTVASADFLGRDKSMFEIQTLPEESSRRFIFDMCVQNKWILTEMTPVETKLEDIFRNLTTK